MLDGHAIAINPADPDGVIFAARMGLFQTHDGGETWQDMEVGRFSPTTYGRDIKVGADGKTLYAALSVAAASKDGGVYRSTDKGQTWSRYDKVQVHGTIMSVAPHARRIQSRWTSARVTKARSTAPRMAARRGSR